MDIFARHRPLSVIDKSCDRYLDETQIIEMLALKFIRSSLMQIDLLATVKRGVALKHVIDHFCGMQRGRAEPLLPPVGARYNR
jgi:hypothetical protein